MGGLRFTALCTASCGVVLLLVASALSSRPPVVYGVGFSNRDETPPGDDGTQQTLSLWAMRHRFYVGDVLYFKHSNDSALLLVRQGDYERCSAASPARRFVGGDTRFTLRRPGLFYFISGAPARCEAGQRMVVRVVHHLTSGAPTPAPETQHQTAATSSRRRPPLSIAQRQIMAGALGFVAGFISIFLLVGLFVFCRS